MHETSPAHLSALFENDWLSVDAHRQEEHTRIHNGKSATRLLAAAKVALSKIIPSKEDVLAIVSCGGSWNDLEFMEVQFPELWVIGPQQISGSRQELLEAYEQMRAPETDAFSMAFWLLALSKLAHQTLAEPNTSGATILGGAYQISDLPKLVCRTIRSKILRYDKLLGCSEGIGLAMLSVRL